MHFLAAKPHRRICIPQGARNEVLQETQPRTSNHFSVMFFRKTRKISDGVLSVLRAKFDTVFGKLSPNLKSFFGDAFSQDKENERRRTSVLQAKFDAVFGKLSPKPQHIFRRCFFRKIRLLSRRCICIPQGARNAVLQETRPEPQHIFRRCFFARQGK